MKSAGGGAMTMAAGLGLSCTYHAKTFPQCYAENVGPSLAAVKQVTDSGAYSGGDVELQHVFCSTHGDRLVVAEKLLSASGYAFKRHTAELGQCTDVQVRSPF